MSSKFKHELDNFRIPPRGLALFVVCAAVAASDAPAATIGAGNNDIEIGVAVGANFLDQPGYEELVRPYDVVVPENEAKMDSVIPKTPLLLNNGMYAFSYKFEGMQRINEMAAKNGQYVKGHTFAFGGQSPKWATSAAPICLFPKVADPSKQQKIEVLKDKTRAMMSAAITQYIHETSVRFPNMKVIDVVNEPVADVINAPVNDSVLLEPNGFQACSAHVSNEAYIDQAFLEAHTKYPDAELTLNEIGADFEGPRQDVLYNLVKSMKSRGIPIDSVGFQGHYDVENDFPRVVIRDELTKTLKKFAELGVDVNFTEVDASMPSDPTPVDYLKQRLIFEGVARACVAQPVCKRVIFWGASDRYSWKGPGSRATLRTVSGRPKAAYHSVRRILKR